MTLYKDENFEFKIKFHNKFESFEGFNLTPIYTKLNEKFVEFAYIETSKVDEIFNCSDKGCTKDNPLFRLITDLKNLHNILIDGLVELDMSNFGHLYEYPFLSYFDIEGYEDRYNKNSIIEKSVYDNLFIMKTIYNIYISHKEYSDLERKWVIKDKEHWEWFFSGHSENLIFEKDRDLTSLSELTNLECSQLLQNELKYEYSVHQRMKISERDFENFKYLNTKGQK